MMKRILSHFGGVWSVIGLWCGGLVAQSVPLGPLGGSGAGVAGEPLIEVTAVLSGGPADLAGLRVGDMIAGADGISFGIHSSNTDDGYQGAVQDLGMAIDRAEGGSGVVTLEVIRPGTGGVEVPVSVGLSGRLGPAWPAASPKADAVYEWSCAEIHRRVSVSASGNFAYNSGWFGMILLSHPDWNSTAGARPYRNSINKLRTRCESYLNGRAFEPVEPGVNQELYDSQAPGLENWDVCASATFLALYRSKTGDAGADAIVQRAAEMIANRIQHWSQYNDAGTVFVPGNGRMGHGGVHGDYSHYNGAGGLNIMNSHAVVALGLLRQAGADVNAVPGTALNGAGGPQPTIDEKFRRCWDWLKQATHNSGGPDDGNVGYVGKQGGGDSSGRTGGAIAGWELYGMAATADDRDHLERQKAYLARRWFRQQHCHAYTLGGVVLSQLATAFLDDRAQRFHQENSAFFSVLSRQPDGSLAYFPGRQNNGGDGYLNTGNVTLINSAIATAVRSGNLPGFPAPDADRLLIHIKDPVASWPALEARRVRLRARDAALDIDITDIDGVVLPPGSYSAAWSQVSGPGAVGFGDPAAAATGVSVPVDGTYRVRLDVSKSGYVLSEPIDLVVQSVAVPAPVAPYIVTQPVGATAPQGGVVTLGVAAQGSEPLIYQWRRNGQPLGGAGASPLLEIDNLSAASAGDYDCVVTNAAGSVTSAAATVGVEGVGGFAWGGLWADVFTGISGDAVGDLTAAAAYPNLPDAGQVLVGGEAPRDYADNFGRRISGWITPPETGNYRFYLASDDASELYLSSDATRANRSRIVSLDGWRNHRQWSGAPASASIPLVGGRRYYVEVLHKESGGADHCGFTWNWDSPGVWNAPSNGEAPLPGAVLEYQVGGTVDDQVQPPADYPPVADAAGYTVFGGEPLALELSGSDFETANLVFTVIEPPVKGVLSGTPPNLTYTPVAGASGTDVFRFVVNDGTRDSPPAAVSLSLVPESGANLKVWEGAVSANWASGGNWIGGVAGASDAVIFDDRVIANFEVDTGGAAAARRLIVADPIGTIGIVGGTLRLGDGIEMLGALEDLGISAPVTLGGDQEWAVGSGAALSVSGDLGGAAVLTKSGPGMLTLDGASPFAGELVVAGGTLRLSGGGWYQGYVGGNSTVRVLDGATAVNVGAHSFGSGQNPGRGIVVDGGTFRFERESYFGNAEVRAGRFEGAGEMRSRSGGSVITVRAAAESSVLAMPFTAVGGASFFVEDGAASADLLVTGSLRGSAALLKDGDGRMVIAGAATWGNAGAPPWFTLRAGRLAVDGSLGAGGNVRIEGGATLEGTGSVLGGVLQEGGLEPGNGGPAVLELGGLSQSGTAETLIEIGGPVAGQDHDRIQVAGAAALGGSLDVVLINGFAPAAGQAFTLLTAASRSASFSAYNLPHLAAGLEWEVVEDPGGMPGLALSVVAVNQPPSFTVDPIDGGMAPVGMPFAGSLAAFAVDGDAGEVLAFTRESGPAWLDVATDGTLTGMPAAGDIGPNAFVVRVTDGSGAFAEATLEIVVAAVNSPPVWSASPLRLGGAVEEEVFTGSVAGFASDADVGDVLAFSKLGGPGWLVVGPDGALAGTPPNGSAGVEAFTLRVEDGAGAGANVALEIEVEASNEPPVFAVDPIQGAAATEDSAYAGSVAEQVTDPNAGDVLVFSKVAGPAWLVVGGDGMLAGTPGNGDVGMNAFTVRVSDGSGGLAEAVLRIEVVNVNDPPVFDADPVRIAGAVEGEALAGASLAGSASDPDAGDVLSFSKVSGPAWLVVAADGGLSGTPPPDSAGTAVFGVRVTDAAGGVDDAVLEIVVEAAGLSLPWEQVGVGDPALAGGASDSEGVFRVSGSGSLGGSRDRFHFVYQPIEGDGEIVARVSLPGDTGGEARVGIMIRDTLASNSRQVFLGVEGSGAFRWVRRTSTGGRATTSRSGTAEGGEPWLKLERVAGMITVRKSLDGENWITLGSLTANLPPTVYAGLVVASGAEDGINISSFDSVGLTP